MKLFKQITALFALAGILLVLFLMPYCYTPVHRICMIACVSGMFIDYFVNRHWQGWHWTPDKWIYVAFLALYLALPLRQLWDPMHSWLIDSKLESFLAFPIIGLVGLSGYRYRMKAEYIAFTMALSCLCMGAIMARYMIGYPLTPFSDWQLQLTEMRLAHLNSHMTVNVYCNICLVCCMWVLLYSSCRKWLKGVLAVVMAGIVVSVLLSDGRIGQITMVVLFLLFAVLWFARSGRRKWLIPVLGGLVLLGGIVWHVNPRFHEYSMHDNPRLYVWSIAKRVIQDKPVLGWGVSSAREEFINRGLNDDQFRAHYVNELEVVSRQRHGYVNYQSMHPHSMFLETWMELGLVGVTVFLACLVLPCVLAPIGVNRWFLSACLLVFCMQGLFESLGMFLNPMWLPVMTFVWACTEPPAV